MGATAVVGAVNPILHRDMINGRPIRLKTFYRDTASAFRLVATAG